MEIKIGCDPEIFVQNKAGELVSAYGMIKGSKDEPFPVTGGAVQVDGMALEFNINPQISLDGWTTSIREVEGQLEKMLPKGHSFAIQPTAEFGKEYIDAQPLLAKQLGCTPDYNAYTGEMNKMPNGDTGFRTASGHIHIGWTKDMDPTDPGHFEACRMLTKQLDVALAIPSLLYDTDSKRREMYGKLGAFRPKPYGVEYRVLSNAWLNDPATISWVFNVAMKATNNLLKGQRYYQSVKAEPKFKSKNPTYWYDMLQQYSPRLSSAELTFFKNAYAERLKEYNEAQVVKGEVKATKAKTRTVGNVTYTMSQFGDWTVA